jgi:hypothetical protein
MEELINECYPTQEVAAVYRDREWRTIVEQPGPTP